MKSKFIKRNQSNRLILLFAGWGMDWRPFAELDHPGYDILVVWDYRELSYNWRPLLKYDEICLIAWSMGVFAASVTIHEIEPRITMRVAVNGTLIPIDDTRGIPPAIWRGTLNALSPATWRKFKRRMCVSAEQYEQFSEVAPRRSLDELKEELIALETHTMFHVRQITDWDLAIISRHDGIFPASNQRRAWVGVAPTRVLDAGHLPDFNEIINRLVINKATVGERFSRAASTYGITATVQHEIARQLFHYFESVHPQESIVGNIIEIGPGADGALTRLWYARADLRAKLLLWDLALWDYSESAPLAQFEQCDAEVRIRRHPSASAAFIFSASTVQWFNSIREFLKECSRVLVPGGYLVLSSFVHGNLEELTSVTGNGLQLPDMDGWKKKMPDDMEILVCEEDAHRLAFESPREVLQHLSDSGTTAVNFGKSGPVMARHILGNYPCDPATGKYNLTYRPIYIVARKFEE